MPMPVRFRPGAPFKQEVFYISRSYKHTPRAGLINDQFHKNYANRVLRRIPLDQLPLKYNSYKKNYNRWLISDYNEVGTSFKDFWSIWSDWYASKEEAYKAYKKIYLRK